MRPLYGSDPSGMNQAMTGMLESQANMFWSQQNELGATVMKMIMMNERRKRVEKVWVIENGNYTIVEIQTYQF